MLDIAAAILLAVFTVIGMVMKLGKKSYDSKEADGFGGIRKVLGGVAGAYVVAKAAKEIFKENPAYNSKRTEDIMDAYREELESAKNGTGAYIAGGLLKQLLGEKRGELAYGLMSGVGNYLETGKLPEEVQKKIRRVTHTHKKNTSGTSKDVMYELMDYAAMHGHEPENVRVLFEKGLGDDNVLGRYVKYTDNSLDIGIPERTSRHMQKIIGRHEIKEERLKRAGLYSDGYEGEALVNSEVMNDLLAHPEENMFEIAALLHYLYKPGNIEHKMIAEETKRRNPKIRKMLADADWQKMIEQYGLLSEDTPNA